MEFWESSSESILLFGPATAMSLVANRLGLSNTGSALPGVFGVLGPCWIIHTREGQGINIAQCSFSIVFQSCRSRSGQSGHGHCTSRRLALSDSRNLRTSAWLVALVLALASYLRLGTRLSLSAYVHVLARGGHGPPKAVRRSVQLARTHTLE